MMVGIKRLEEHGQRAVRIIHPKTGRGLAFLYDIEDKQGLKFVRNADAEESIRHDIEKVMDDMIKENYLCIGILDNEFDRLHKRTLRFPLFKEDNEFEQIKMPQIRKLVEENTDEYYAQIDEFYKQHNLYKR